MATGISDYRLTIEQSRRCLCGPRYFVFTGAPFAFNQQALEAAGERVAGRGARFIDARTTRWLISSAATC